MLLILFSSVLNHHHHHHLSIFSTEIVYFLFVTICLYLNTHHIHLVGKQNYSTNDDDKIIDILFTLFKCSIGNILFFLALSQLNTHKKNIYKYSLKKTNNYCFRTKKMKESCFILHMSINKNLMGYKKILDSFSI